MKCPNCERHVPQDASYCIYCAVQLQPAAPTPPVNTVAPATGPTTRLNPEGAPSYTPPPTMVAPQPAPVPMPRAGRARRNKDAGTAFFLIGLGVLFLTGMWWPGILLLIGATAFVNESARGKHDHALQGLIFFGGLALLAWTDFWWPGILILIGLSSLFRSKHGWGRW